MHFCVCGKYFTRSDNLRRHQLQSCQGGPSVKRVQLDTDASTPMFICNCSNVAIPATQVEVHERSLQHKDSACIQLSGGVQITKSSFKCRVVIYRMDNSNVYTEYMPFFNDVRRKVIALLEAALIIHTIIKVNMEVCGSYVSRTQDISDIKSFGSQNEIMDQSTDLNSIFDSFREVIIAKIEEFHARGSGWSCEKVMFLEVDVNKWLEEIHWNSTPKAELNATSKPEVQSVESIPGNSSQQLDIGYFAEPTPSSSQTEDIKNRPTEIPKDRPKENPKNRPTENPKNRPTEKRNYSGKVYCRMCLEPIGARNQMVPLTLMDINFPTKSAAFKKSKEMETYRITDMIQVVMPDFDFDAAYNPIVCHKCIVRLESAYNFIKGCQENENMIQLYKSEYCPDEELVSCEDVALNKSLLMEQSSPRKKRKTSKGHISSGSLPAQSGSQIEQRGNTTAEHYEIVYTSSVGQENLIPETSSELRTAIKCETDDYEDYKLDGDSHFLVQPEEVSCIVKEEIVVKEDVSCDFTDTTNNERIAQMSMDYHVKDEVCSQPDALSISDTGDYHTNSTQYSTTNQNSQTFSRPKT